MTTSFNVQSQGRQKTNWFTVLPFLAASGATRTSVNFVNYSGLGLMLQAVVANLATTPTYTPKIMVDNGISGGANVQFVSSFTALSANGTYILVVYPVTLTDMGDQRKIATLPREWKLELTFGGSGSADITVLGRYI